MRLQEDVPDFEKETRERGEPRLFVLDDLLNDVYSRQVCDLFTKGSHHRNISVILITQNLFHQGRYCRDILLNATYLVLLKNVGDMTQFAYLARQRQSVQGVSGRDATAAWLSDPIFRARHGRPSQVSNHLSGRGSTCDLFGGGRVREKMRRVRSITPYTCC